MKNPFMSAIILIVALIIFGCAESNSQTSYRQISSDEAEKLMEKSSNYVILDVRTQQEFESGHISGAICIPNETIKNDPPTLLPDKKQTIFVYCRTGRRSKEAAQKLSDMGYENIIEFGGIITWKGKIDKN